MIERVVHIAKKHKEAREWDIQETLHTLYVYYTNKVSVLMRPGKKERQNICQLGLRMSSARLKSMCGEAEWPWERVRKIVRKLMEDFMKQHRPSEHIRDKLDLSWRISGQIFQFLSDFG